MTREEIKRELREILLMCIDSESDIVEFGDDDILSNEEYGIDSLSMMLMIVEMERRFNIEVEEDLLSFEFLSSINAIASYVYEEMERNL